jgi:type 1 glutamine amidotransferase
MLKLDLLLLIATLFLLQSCNQEKNVPPPPPKHIVFITGDEEYRSEESMPMLASILEKEGYKVSVCYALDSLGFIAPDNTRHIAGLEILDSADMMVLFTRFRELPWEEAKHIVDFAESGRPMAGFRTATHAFSYKTDSSLMYLNNDWPTKVFGQKWITHHGHFADGHGRLTDVQLIAEKKGNPILNGVEPFEAYSWLYHVDGGQDSLYGDCEPLLVGTALRSNHANENRLDQFPISNPVAWTKTYAGRSGKTANVFFTTLGHPYDFKETAMRKLALNGIVWAIEGGDKIPVEGMPADFVAPYEPNNSGFGKKYKLGRKP